MKNAHIKEILENARKKTYNAINFAMVEAYWEIGKSIQQQIKKTVYLFKPFCSFFNSSSTCLLNSFS